MITVFGYTSFVLGPAVKKEAGRSAYLLLSLADLSSSDW